MLLFPKISSRVKELPFRPVSASGRDTGPGDKRPRLDDTVRTVQYLIA
jgi:hypothetical protein